MIIRLLSFLFLGWMFGFIWFVFALPEPAEDEQTDAVIVPTGSAGRIPHGLEVLEDGYAEQMLVSGVDPEVKHAEFAAQFDVSASRMECCVTLGFNAVDTRSNAQEIAGWVAEREITSLRLVTADWHMRRAAHELELVLPDDIEIVRDAVQTEPRLSGLMLEYNKLIASWISGLLGL
ncbi:YdcF family protein [Erythrobacter sp. HA6-11]